MAQFTRDDVAQYQHLEDLLLRKANWAVSTPEAVQLYKALIWYTGLKKKIEDHIMQVEYVKSVAAKTEAPDASKE